MAEISLPKDAAELFDVMVPKGLAAFPEKASELGAIYGFKVSGEGGGEWTVDCTANPPACIKGDTSKAQCTISVSAEDFKTMLSDPQAGMQLFLQGKLQVVGDPMLAMKLQSLLDLAKV